MAGTRSDKKKEKEDKAEIVQPLLPEIKVKEEPIDAATAAFQVITLDNGNSSFFDSVEDANEFMETFETIVRTRKGFNTKSDALAYKKIADEQKASAPTTPSPKSVVEVDRKLSPDERESVERVKRKLDLMAPKNALEVHYKTTNRSSCVILVFRFKDVLGKDFWTLKPSHLKHCLKAYLTEFPVESVIVSDALSNIDTGVMRDPSKSSNSPMEKVLKKRAKSDSNEPLTLTEYVAYTHFNLPVLVDAKTKDEKTILVEDSCRQIASALKKIMSGPTYLAILQHHVSDKFWAMMESPNSGPSYVTYVKDMTEIIAPLSNLNTHLILDDVKVALDLLSHYPISTETD